MDNFKIGDYVKEKKYGLYQWNLYKVIGLGLSPGFMFIKNMVNGKATAVDENLFEKISIEKIALKLLRK